MRYWQDAIHRYRVENSPATVGGCRIHVQDAIRRVQADRAPDTARSTCIGDERSYNELRASNCCRADRGRFDLCQCFCADAAAVSTSGNTTAAETDPACAVSNATAGNYAAAKLRPLRRARAHRQQRSRHQRRKRLPRPRCSFRFTRRLNSWRRTTQGEVSGTTSTEPRRRLRTW